LRVVVLVTVVLPLELVALIVTLYVLTGFLTLLLVPSPKFHNQVVNTDVGAVGAVGAAVTVTVFDEVLVPPEKMV
jgi:hypothetical protein